MKGMAGLMAAVGMLGCVDGGDPSVGVATGHVGNGPSVFHDTYRSESVEIQFPWSMNLGGSFAAWNDGVGANATAHISAAVWGLDPVHFYLTTIIQGSPAAGDLVIGANTASLHVTDPTGLTIETCGYDPMIFQYTCITPPQGPIDLTWTKVDNVRFSSNGVQSMTYDNVTIRSQGSSSSTGALATGTLLGLPLADVEGRFADSRGVTITREVVVQR